MKWNIPLCFCTFNIAEELPAEIGWDEKDELTFTAPTKTRRIQESVTDSQSSEETESIELGKDKDSQSESDEDPSHEEYSGLETYRIDEGRRAIMIMNYIAKLLL